MDLNLDLNSEIARLRELLPATGRMKTRLVLNDAQAQVIVAKAPRIGQSGYPPIRINLKLWQQLSQPQRDLLYLQRVCWLISAKPLKVQGYAAAAAGGAALTVFELLHQQPLGVLAAGGITTFIGLQLWRRRGDSRAGEADDAAIRVAVRRGYTPAAAAEALLGALDAVAAIEGQRLSTEDLSRRQHLRQLTQLPQPTEALEVR